MPIRAEMKARYPDDWKLRSQFVRFVRAQGRCEWVENGKRCLAMHGDRIAHGASDRPVVLTTAHLFDHRPESASLLNLAAMCQKHHLAYDATFRSARNRLPEQALERPEIKDLEAWELHCGYWDSSLWGTDAGELVKRGQLMGYFTTVLARPVLYRWQFGHRTTALRSASDWQRWREARKP
jgi:hypothetical protein